MMYLKKYSKKTWFIAMISTFIFGLFTHLFGLVNIIHNYDDIAVQPAGVGTSLSSGRWFLHILAMIFGKMFGNYNISLWNGVIFIILISISTSFFIQTFEIKSRKNAIIIGIIFITFPTATSTLFFKYTSVYYSIAILMSICAAWSARKCKYGYVISPLLTSFSLGIYQAYIPFTIAIFVLLLLKDALIIKNEVKILFKRGIYYCYNIIAGLIFYFLFLKIILIYYKTSLSNYQEINNMGKLSFSDIPYLIKEAFISFVLLPINDYCSLTFTLFIKLLYLLLFIIIITSIIYILFIKKENIDICLFIVLICLLIPISINFIVIMCPNSTIYTLMVYPFTLVLCTPMIIFESLPIFNKNSKNIKTILSKASTLVVLLISVNYAYFANVNYTSLYYVNRQTENYLQSIIAQVRMTEGFTTNRQWALIGKINDPLFTGGWSKLNLYGGNSNKLINSYSRNAWFNQYCGYSIPFADKETINDIKQHNEFIEMPCWPNDGSIKVINNIIVIKFEDSEDSLN